MTLMTLWKSRCFWFIWKPQLSPPLHTGCSSDPSGRRQGKVADRITRDYLFRQGEAIRLLGSGQGTLPPWDLTELRFTGRLLMTILVMWSRPMEVFMHTAAVSEIKASLSEYLGKVKAGEDILITERGRPIARIVPLRRESQVAGQLEYLEKRGLVKIGSGGLPDDFWSMSRPLDSGAAGLTALLEEREDGR